MDCTRPEISERLMMALFPEEFPEEQQSIQVHVQDCAACRKELDLLRNIYDVMREHRSELVDSVCNCPSPTEIVELSLNECSDSALQHHIEHCCVCKEELALIGELEEEPLETDHSSTPTMEEKLVIRNAILKEYGPLSEKKPFAFSAWLSSFASMLHMPSMAIGAVAAALLVAVLIPWSTREAPSHLVLTDTKWESPAPQFTTKSGMLSAPAKRVALIILVRDGADLAADKAGQLYGDINLARNMGQQYEFISPGVVKTALATMSEKPLDVPDAARMVLDKTDADYVLAFRVDGTGTKLNLAGSLYQRSDKKLLGFVSWDFIPQDRLSDKMMLIGTELLSWVEPS